jgi:hypothetical protein
MLPVGDLLDELLPLVVAIGSFGAVKKELLEMVRSPPLTKFAGAVHCEAILMGLTTACAEQPTNPRLSPDCVWLLKVNPFPLVLNQTCLGL